MKENFDLINLNVGGKKFITYYDTLKRSTYFQELVQDNVGVQAVSIEDEEDQYFFIDRDGDTFEDILHYLRSCEIHQTSQERLRKLEHEATFYGFDELKAKANQALHDWMLDKEDDIDFYVENVNENSGGFDATFSGNLNIMPNDSIIGNKIRYPVDHLVYETKLIFKSTKKK